MADDLSHMTTRQAVMILRAKCNELEAWVLQNEALASNRQRQMPAEYAVADIALVMGIVGTFIERLDKRLTELERRVERLTAAEEVETP